MAKKARSRIYTHLWYAKEAEEAARFYASVFQPQSALFFISSSR
jgi:predicted 3-demethylubiquinone-9 3-methyltransferase (glyoxalase superfamily)